MWPVCIRLETHVPCKGADYYATYLHSHKFYGIFVFFVITDDRLNNVISGHLGSIWYVKGHKSTLQSTENHVDHGLRYKLKLLEELACIRMGYHFDKVRSAKSNESPKYDIKPFNYSYSISISKVIHFSYILPSNCGSQYSVYLFEYYLFFSMSISFLLRVGMTVW